MDRPGHCSASWFARRSAFRAWLSRRAAEPDKNAAVHTRLCKVNVRHEGRGRQAGIGQCVRQRVAVESGRKGSSPVGQLGSHLVEAVQLGSRLDCRLIGAGCCYGESNDGSGRQQTAGPDPLHASPLWVNKRTGGLRLDPATCWEPALSLATGFTPKPAARQVWDPRTSLSNSKRSRHTEYSHVCQPSTTNGRCLRSITACPRE